MANTDEQDWIETAPANVDDRSVGAQEIRVLRQSVHDRINKSHVHIDTAGVGGEPLEGSARVHTATSAPTNQVIGAKDIDGNAADVTIASDTAIAEGAIWSHTTTAICQVYIAGAWVSMGYLPLSGGTTTGTITLGANIVAGDNSITGIDTLTFTDTAGTIAGVANGNLLDKSATETVSGAYTFSAAGTAIAVTNNVTIGGTLAVTSTLTASSFGGILSANLLDKTATETVSGAYTFTEDVTITDKTLIVTSATAGYGISVTTSDNFAGIYVEGAFTGIACLDLNHTGNGAHINFAGDPANSSSNDGDLWFDGTNFKVNIAGTSYTIDLTAV